MIKHLLNLFLVVPVVALGATVSYEFDIDTVQLNVTGTPVAALAIDRQIPAPTIRASVGDTLRVTFHNHLVTTTSVHWHGILLPSDQDGVPYLNTQPIPPGESHTFEFPILHDGTFWYHSHTDLQIQHGLYGAVVLRDEASLLPEDQVEDQVVVFSDWTNEDAETVLANLKKSDDFYAWKKGKVQSWDKVFANGRPAVRNRIDSALTRMGPMDLTDVGYDAYLANGKQEGELPLLDPTARQVKLRLVNGATSSYFDVEYAGGPMTVVAADGQDVQPLRVQRLRISTAETYDVLVPLTPGQAYELRATSFDGTGHSSLFVGPGERTAAPDLIPPNLYLMDHMDMSGMDMDMDMDMPGMDMDISGMDMDMDMDMDRVSNNVMSAETTTTASDSHDGHSGQNENTKPMPMPVDTSTLVEDSSAQANHDNHAGHAAEAQPMPETSGMEMAMPGEVIEHMTDYRYLAARQNTSLPDDQSWRDIELTLTGNMERYVWSFDGQTVRENPQVMIRAGENVRFHLTNDTMMNHPLHLHGHFFRLVNEQGERSPLKHTVNVPPMGHVVIEFNASEKADWLFHCHNQYHMKTGMNRVVSYEQTSTFNPQMADLIVPSIRWFKINEFHLLTSFADYELSVSDERHGFDLELDTDLDDTLELHLFYNYHFNRFVSAFGGLERREHHHGKNHDLPVAGVNILLPFMVDSEWRVDDHGRFRLELESQMHFTRRFGFDWRWNSDDEHRYGFSYRLSNRLSFTVHTDTEYGDGIGVQFFY